MFLVKGYQEPKVKRHLTPICVIVYPCFIDQCNLPTNYKNLESSTWTCGRNNQPIYIQRGCSTSHRSDAASCWVLHALKTKGCFYSHRAHSHVYIEIKHLLPSPWHPSLTHNLSSSRDSSNWAAERDYHFRVSRFKVSLWLSTRWK